jgi:hypothetical protein
MHISHAERWTPTVRQFVLVLAAVTWFALLLPVGARAAGQLVTLVDPTSSTKARVDGGGSFGWATGRAGSRSTGGWEAIPPRSARRLAAW